jgi:3-oxoadipate enol-lactonase
MQVMINGMTMLYEEHGAGPAVLLLDGLPADPSLWQSHIQPLMLAGYRVIVPDLRGFGEGSAAAGDYRMETLSNNVVGLLNYLGIGRVAIVGLSSSTHVLRALLQRYPHRLAAAVFAETLKRKGIEADCADLSELATKRQGRGGCLVHYANDVEDIRGLLDFFAGVKRFRPRCPVYRQVA